MASHDLDRFLALRYGLGVPFLIPVVPARFMVEDSPCCFFPSLYDLATDSQTLLEMVLRECGIPCDWNCPLLVVGFPPYTSRNCMAGTMMLNPDWLILPLTASN